MIARIKHWLTPPVFPADPLKTRRADFLNTTLLAILVFAPLLILGNLWGGHTPVLVTFLNFSVALIVIGARYVLRRGHVELASLIMLVAGLTIVTLAAANLGTIRTPTTTAYLVIVIIAGAIFGLPGLVLAMALSVLAMLGLVLVEMSGGLPSPDYTVTITQWVTYSALFGSISLLSHVALRWTRQALQQADRELAERQRTERVLRQREEQLREAQHLAQLGSWEWDRSTQTLTWSDEVYNIFGVTPADTVVSVETFERFIHPDDRDDFLRRRAEMLEQTHTATIDHRIIRRDGEVRWVQERAQFIPDAAGQARRVTGTVQDITDRKQLEVALRQSEVRYRSLFEDSPISLWEEDFSRVKRYLDSLRQSGVTDLRAYFVQHPEAVNTCAKLVQVLNVNQATLDLLEMPDKAAVLSNLTHTLAAEAHAPFRDELCTLADGAQQWVMDEALRTATGGELFITVYVSIAPGYADTWGKVLVSILDITERKQVEQALRESQQMIEGIINTVPVRVFWKDKNLAYLGCNAAFAHDAGFAEPADLIGKDDYQLGWRAQADLYRADDRQVIDSGCAKSHIEEPQTTPDGRTITLLTNKVPLRNTQGKISGVLGTYMDITERKRAEVAERDQRQLAEALRDTAAALNSTLELPEVLDHILASVERLVPHEAANIMLIDNGVAHIVRNRGFIERGLAQWMTTANFRVDDVANMRYMQATGQPLAIPNVRNYMGWVETPESRWVASHIGAPLRLKGRVIGFLNLDTATPDFYTPLHAERLQAFADQAAAAIENARLLEAEHSQRVLAEALRDTAATLNSTLDLDEVFERILVNVERVVDHDTANLMLIDEQGVARIVRHRGYAERGLVEFAARVRLTVSAVPNLQHMTDTGEPRVMPNVRREPDWIDWPESHWIQSIASAPIRLKNATIGFINLNSGTPDFYTPKHGERLRAFANQAAVAVENARLYEAVQQHAQTLEQRVRERTVELLAANQRLTELDHMKDEFLSRISHELRTPLTSIKIYLELLEVGKPDKRDKYMQTLKREADRLHVLIEDVLTITRLSRETLTVTLANADLNLVLEPRLATWQELAAQRALAFWIDLAPALPLARLDKLLTLQIMTQLINNALSYTPTGSITLTTRACADEAGRWLTVNVSDTGPGITPDDLPNIFERFYRGRAAADYKTPGTGVGLSISREIVEKLGGRLTVETHVGVGSTFTLWLPAAD